jgi:hypothetical protein
MHGLRTLLCLAPMLLGCGDDSASDQALDVTKLGFGSKECPSGGIRVNVDDENYVVCNGSDGTPGMAGSNGKDGSDGTDGASLTPESLLYCSKITSLPDAGGSIRLSYHVAAFSDGSSLVSCEAETTGVVSASSTNLYAPWQMGASSLGCSVTSDAAGPATAGWWKFEMEDGTAMATYHDVGEPDDLAFYAFKTADCTSQKAP